MSDTDETGDVRVVSAEDAGEGAADLTAEPGVEAQAERADVHVITLKGADGFELCHPQQCDQAVFPAGDAAPCPVAEAAGRISRAMCETLGTWTCDVDAGGLVLLEQLGDA